MANIIRESSPPFASPIILVEKKDGSTRMCVDYRELDIEIVGNTQPNHYPLPLISEKINLMVLIISVVLICLRVHESSIKKTAFVTPKRQFEYSYALWVTQCFFHFSKAIHTDL